ncbi:MAG: acetoacetate decarboxylase family protein [Acidimicrobiales bacterium]
MGFVKTSAEIAAIESRLRNPQFLDARVLQIQFETNAGFARSLVPPPLEATDPLDVLVRIGQYRSNCVGDFAGAGIYLPARFGDVTGVYVLTMFMDTDAAVIFGRETFGEPKKLASVNFSYGSRSVSASVRRHGVELISAAADLGVDAGPVSSTSYAFNVKSWTAADGEGLEADAVLTQTRFETRLRVNQVCEGSIALRSTVHDPLGELVIKRVKRVNYYEGDHSTFAKAVATIPAATFLPYAYGRNDDWSAAFPRPV